jgi:hypothetical protein
LWTVPAAGTIVSGQGTTSIVVSYPSTALTGVVTATAVNNCANSTTRSISIRLLACPAPPPPLPFTFSGKSGDKTGMLVSIDKMDVSVFPNPSMNYFNMRVQSASKEVVKVTLTDVLGRILLTNKLVPGANYTFGNQLKAGTYFMEVRQGMNVSVQKVLKF